MPIAFSPKFADLVRCATSTTGTGNFVLGAVPSGYKSFASVLSASDRFYYAATGVTIPSETEIGRGTFMADGTIAREAISGTLTNFSGGQKTLSLVTAAEWFRKANLAAIDSTTLLTRDQSNLGAAINELAKLSPLFSEIGTTRVPVSVRRIFTAGRTAVGQYPGAYFRDPDQSALTTIGQQLVDALPLAEQVAAIAAVKAILDRVRAKDADGLYWVIDDDGCEVHAGHFGAVADGWFAYNGSIAGTDNAAAIQALIDWRVYLQHYTPRAGRECLLPPGALRINKGLQLGYGESFRTVVLRGTGPVFGGAGAEGTTLVCDFDDQPGIAIQSGRISYVADLSIACPRGISYLYAKQLGGYDNGAMTAYGIDDRQLASWYDPARPTMSPYLRYNPCAGIAVDPYCGPKPQAAAAWAAVTAVGGGQYRTANGNLYAAKLGGVTASSGTGPAATTDSIVDGTVTWAFVGPSSVSTSYPDANPPAFIPSASRATYGVKGFSSNIPLSNVRIYGFTVGVAVQPCDADSNADFLNLEDCEITYAAFQISVGNTQSRNVGATRLTGSFFHTAVTTTKHGRQNGKLGGLFANCSWGGGHQLIDIGATSIVGPHTFKQCYAEDIRRIGSVQAFGGGAGTAIVFEGCQFDFVHDRGNGKRGVPLSLLGNPASPGGSSSVSSSYVFRDCVIGGHLGVAPMLAFGVRFENTTIQGAESFSFASQWRARAFNTLAGGLVLPVLASQHEQSVHYLGVNETNFSPDAQIVTTRGNKQSSRDYPASIYTSSLSPTYGQSTEDIANPRLVNVMDKGSLTSMSLVGRTLTFTVPGLATSTALVQGLVPGTVLIDQYNGMVFFVQTRTGTSSQTVTAELQNGYSYSTGGAISYEVPFTATGGYYFAGGGIFTPGYPLLADLNVASTTLSNCQRADGYAGFITSGTGSMIQAGDQPFADQLIDTAINANSAVTAVGAGAITLNNVPQITATKKRLPLWVRGS